MKLAAFVLPTAALLIFSACSSTPLTPEQSAALAAKEDCIEVTGSRLKHCGPSAWRDANIKTVDADAARCAIGAGTTGGVHSNSGGG